MNERGEDHDGQPQGFLIIFLKNGPTVMASAKKTEECCPRKPWMVSRYNKVYKTNSQESWKSPLKEVHGPTVREHKGLQCHPPPRHKNSTEGRDQEGSLSHWKRPTHNCLASMDMNHWSLLQGLPVGLTVWNFWLRDFRHVKLLLGIVSN